MLLDVVPSADLEASADPAELLGGYLRNVGSADRAFAHALGFVR